METQRVDMTIVVVILSVLFGGTLTLQNTTDPGMLKGYVL